MSTSTSFQIAQSAAVRYQEMVPYFLGPFADALIDYARIGPGMTVIDIGCGTGAATRAAAKRVGPSGKVLGTDINPGMVEVARAQPPVEGAVIEWTEAGANSLPGPDAAADRAIASQVFQFVPDRVGALAESFRVVKPGGLLAFTVWRPLEENPYFNALIPELGRHLGEEVAAGLRAAFQWSDPEAIRSGVTGAGYEGFELREFEHSSQLPELHSFIPFMLGATPVGPGFAAASPEAREALIQGVIDRTADYRSGAGIAVPFRTFIVRANRP